MIRTLIIEDEPYIREGLKSLISEITDELTIVGECGSVSEALVLYKACQPDLVFLDINLVDGSGFDFLQQVGEPSFRVVFITAYEDHVMQALKAGAIDYILKPVNPDELEEAIKKVSRFSGGIPQEHVRVASENLEGKQQRIVLRMQEGYQLIDFDDLMYCKSDGGYTTFHRVDGSSFMVARPLKDFDRQLPATTFIRTHQSYLVNIRFVDRFDKTRFIYLKNGDKIPVSIRKKEEIISRIFG